MAPYAPRCLLLLAVLLMPLASTTRLTFYIDHAVEQPLDFVEIDAVVKARGDSLEATIEEAAGTIARIEGLVAVYCKTYTPKAQQRAECSQMIEVAPYSIKPQYELLKSKELFGGNSHSIQASSWPTISSSGSRTPRASADSSTTSSKSGSARSTLSSGNPKKYPTPYPGSRRRRARP
jgi:hypothetical protein